ncbi:hypothetical protein [Hydrogenimonas sp.]
MALALTLAQKEAQRFELGEGELIRLAEREMAAYEAEVSYFRAKLAWLLGAMGYRRVLGWSAVEEGVEK